MKLFLNSLSSSSAIVPEPEIPDLMNFMDLINLQSDDASKFTIVPTNKVSVWKEENNTEWTQSTDANRPLLVDGVVFDGVNDTVIRNSDLSANDYSFYCVFKFIGSNTGALANRVLFASKTANDWLGIGANYKLQLNVATVTLRSIIAGYKGNRAIVFGMRKSGNNFTFTINDRVCIQSGSNAIESTLFGRIGSLANFSMFNSNINLKSFCLSSTVLTDAQNKEVVDYLYERYSLSSDTTTDNICGFGDSNTFGISVTPYLVGLSAQMNLAHLNLGIPGTVFVNSTAQLNNGYDRYQKQLVTKPYTDYIVVQYGTNDVLAGLPVELFETQMSAMISDLITKGYNPSKICLCSNPYQKTNANATLLNSYRTAILSIATLKGTKYFDLLQDMRDNGGDSLLNDPVHLSQDAHLRWQNGVYNAFNS